MTIVALILHTVLGLHMVSALQVGTVDVNKIRNLNLSNLSGEKNGLTAMVGEPANINPAGFENCSTLHTVIRFVAI